MRQPARRGFPPGAPDNTAGRAPDGAPKRTTKADASARNMKRTRRRNRAGPPTPAWAGALAETPPTGKAAGKRFPEGRTGAARRSGERENHPRRRRNADTPPRNARRIRGSVRRSCRDRGRRGISQTTSRGTTPHRGRTRRARPRSRTFPMYGESPWRETIPKPFPRRQPAAGRLHFLSRSRPR